ncbi:MAG: DUF2157 domain-containing protein, partial [Methylocella sp.]
MRLKTQLQRWQTAEIIDAPLARRIEAYEESRHGFRFSTAMFGLGALAIVLGVAAVVGSNWDAIPATFKLIAQTLLNLALAAGILHAIRTERTAAREIMLFLLAGFTLTLIALIGQIYQTGAPLWQALALWLVITSPFLFFLARAKFTIACWMLSFWTALGMAAETVAYHLGPMRLDAAFYALIPFLMIGTGNWRILRTRWPVWPSLLAMGGYALTAWVVSWAQLAWIEEFGYGVHDYTTHIYPAFFAALAASGALPALRRAKYLEAKPYIADLFMLVSVVAGFMPFLMPHPHWPVAGAGIFMAYWALIGWTGLRLGYRGLLNAAIVIIALRLAIVYIEVFGDLLSTGAG